MTPEREQEVRALGARFVAPKSKHQRIGAVLAELLADLDEERARSEAAAVRRAVLVIRSLGFIGNTHYRAVCLNEFHADRGQHGPGCACLEDIQNEEDWWWRD